MKKTRTICAKIVALSMKSAVGMTTDTSYVSSLPTSGTVCIEILAKRDYAQSGEAEPARVYSAIVSALSGCKCGSQILGFAVISGVQQSTVQRGDRMFLPPSVDPTNALSAMEARKSG